MPPTGIIDINGAEKVVGEFPQGDGILPYFVFIDGGRRNNLIKLALFLFASLPIAAGIATNHIFPVYFGLAFLAAALFIFYVGLLKEATAGFLKEKAFLTNKSFVVQHSLCSRAVKFIELRRIKDFRRLWIPGMGTFVWARHMDLENIDTLTEPLYFPRDADELESSVLEAAVRIKAADLEKKLKKEEEETKKSAKAAKEG